MSELVWATRRPEQPGAYWWRSPASPGKVLAMIHEEKAHEGVSIFTSQCPCFFRWSKVKMMYPDCQWAGPLPEPEDV